jgi:gas vesicle protein
MAQHNENSYTKGLAVGMILGGAIGAAIALLLAPKSGAELRRDIAERSEDLYGRASEFAGEQSKRFGEYVNEGRTKADEIVRTTRQQAGQLLSEAETMMKDARVRIGQATQTGIKDNIGRIQDAAQAGAEAFRQEMGKNRFHGNDTDIA